MRIKSLQITGFKSFVDRVSFSFRPGITGIVGPNGCGKSNVVDAIRWAMGEQSPRRLRGKGMDDVIFAGSEARAPVGVAEVVLTFDNADGVAPPEFAAYSEIQVSRRLYRSGESEYLINKTPCRLRDVLDFFRDTGIGTKGYTIVEQGHIAEIVSAKAEERRALIEEAAGIGKYKARRREAERKLEGTEQNLVRVKDVLHEIRRQIGSLERQARKAAQYKRLRELQRVAELSLASDERRELAAASSAGRERAVTLRDAVAAAETRLAEREAALEERRLALAERERELVQGNEELFQIRGEIKELESRIGYERRERASLAELGQARARERDELLAQLQVAEVELDRLAGELAAVEALLSQEGESVRAAEAEARTAEQAVAGAEAEREGESQALVDVLTRTARSEDRLASVTDRRAELARRLRTADEQLELQLSEAQSAEGEQRHLEEGLRNLLAERDRLGVALRDALIRGEHLQRDAKERAERLRARRELREVRRARLASFQEILERREDVGAGVRHLLSAPEEERARFGFLGLVRDAFEVAPELERAVEAVLADRAEGVVVTGAEGVGVALDRLRAAAAGRGVFVLARGEEAGWGFVPLGTPLLPQVRPRAGFEGVARALLGHVNVVDSLGEALALYGSGRIPCTFVTRSGDVLTPDGVVRGGGAAAQAGVLTRVREVRELAAEVEALDAEVLALEQESRVAEATLQAAGDELDNLRSRHHTAALAVASHEKDLERTRERVKALGEAQESRASERGEFQSEVEALEAELARLGELLAELRERRARHQRQLDAQSLRVASARRELSRLEAVVTERRVQHATREDARARVAGALERSRAAAGETQRWVQQRDAEIRTGEERREQLAHSIAAAEAALAERLREEERARLAGEAKREEYERVAGDVRALEEATRDVRIELETSRDEAQQAELGLRELELRIAHLDASVRDRWNVELVAWKPPLPAADDGAEAVEALEPATEELPGGEPATAEAAEGAPADDGLDAARAARRDARELAEILQLDAAARRERVADIRQRLEAIGEVNLGAIEEHEELRERFRFLDEQRNDLESSVAQLREAIARINRTSRKRFQETFEAVNERFQENFPRLFRGGKAFLTLTEAEDVLEAGIEITAQPPGKRPQTVNLLSGGEKTMTAIALLVSVFQVRPSPFFLLDEVDAALDDANVGRFNEIVKELAAQSQFLVITHNKRTIEVADVLYGVTMEERGVSKLVAVELS